MCVFLQPLFVKPEHGYDSVGIDDKSLIFNLDDLSARVAKIIDEFGSALVEKYVDGREFSVLVAGATKGVLHVFPPVEYRFAKDRLPGYVPPATASTAAGEKDLVGANATTICPPDASVVSTPSPSLASDGGDMCSSSAASSPISSNLESSPLPLPMVQQLPANSFEVQMQQVGVPAVNPTAPGTQFLTFQVSRHTLLLRCNTMAVPSGFCPLPFLTRCCPLLFSCSPGQMGCQLREPLASRRRRRGEWRCSVRGVPLVP
jgi:hypothetical protein